MRNKTGEKDKGHMTIGIFLTTIGLMFLLGDLIGGIPIMIIGGLIWYFWHPHLKELFDKITEL